MNHIRPVDQHSPEAHTCAAVKACTRPATTVATLDHHVVVWACDRHGTAAPSLAKAA